MKKITLISILLFALIVGTLYIGSMFGTNNSQTTSNKGVAVSANTIFKGIDISNVKFKSQPTSPGTLTTDEVSKHNTKNDCYLVVNNKVYDVSSYISYHPGGSRVIVSRCGREVTGIFAKIHSNRAWDLLKKYKIGTIGTSKPSTAPQALNAISKALKEANPNIEVIKVSPKSSFYVAKIVSGGKLYEVHISGSGRIIKEEVQDAESNWSFWNSDNDDK